jgi:hypothetical protein
MKTANEAWAVLLALCLCVSCDPAYAAPPSLVLTAQKDYLDREPVLVVVRLAGDGTVPAEVGGKGEATLSFDIKPAVKARKGAKPLPLEAASSGRRARVFDLLEWYQLPAQGEFTVTATIKRGEKAVTSAPVTLKLRKPDKKDAEWGPVDRIHHIPWSNYVTNAFCGDTFDVAKRWPDSRMAKYCHYHNGLHHMHKKEYDKALASLTTVVEKFPDFVLARDADAAIHECLVALGKKSEAAKYLETLRKRAEKDTTGRFQPPPRVGGR